MNWDWDKLSKQRQGRGPGAPTPPNFDDFAEKFRNFKKFRFPGGKIIVLVLACLWLASGIYIVEPDEVGVVLRFGAFDRVTTPGPHYHIPYPIESVMTPKVTQVRRVELGFRSTNTDRSRSFEQGQGRGVPEESLMLTGDENIVDVQFSVQYRILDAEAYLFNVYDVESTVGSAAEAAMREIIGKHKIDDALTTGKLEIQNQTRDLMQQILDAYGTGVTVEQVQLQNVHPPEEVIDAFKDVASAREDKSRFINEAEAYQNDILPRARGEAAVITNQAEAYRETRIRAAEGDAARFLSVLEEYRKAPRVTRERMFIETMEAILSNPDTEKLILSDEALRSVIPYLPLDRRAAPSAQQNQ